MQVDKSSMDKLQAQLIKDAKIARYSQKETVEEYYSERFESSAY